MQWSIIILTMNSFGRTVSTLASVRRAVKSISSEIVVVDNGSSADMTSWLSSQGDIRLILNGENLGVPKARNIGLRAAKYDRILFLDNDVDLEPYAIPLFNDRLNDPTVGLVGDSGSLLIPEWALTDVVSHDTSDASFPGTNFVVGYCMATRLDIVQTVGWFDEDYPPYYWEDIDYAIRIRKAGYDIAVVSETCYHHKRATVAASNCSDQVKRVENQGRLRTLSKHGSDCPVWALAIGGNGSQIAILEEKLSEMHPHIVLHVVSPDLSVENKKPWRVVLPGEMYSRYSYSRVCVWNDGWDISLHQVPERNETIAYLNDSLSRRPW